MAVTIDRDTCIGCSACVGVCPVSALSMDGEGKSLIRLVQNIGLFFITAALCR